MHTEEAELNELSFTEIHIHSYYFLLLVPPQSYLSLVALCRMDVCVLSCFSRVQLFVTLWTVARQALSMGFSGEEYRSRLPCPSPGDLPNPGIEHASCVSCIAGEFLPLSHRQRKPCCAACGILIPYPEIEPMLPMLGAHLLDCQGGPFFCGVLFTVPVLVVEVEHLSVGRVRSFFLGLLLTVRGFR